VVSAYHRGGLVYFREIAASSFREFLMTLYGDPEFAGLGRRYPGVRVLVRFIPDDSVFLMNCGVEGLYSADPLEPVDVPDGFEECGSFPPVMDDFNLGAGDFSVFVDFDDGEKDEC